VLVIVGAGSAAHPRAPSCAEAGIGATAGFRWRADGLKRCLGRRDAPLLLLQSFYRARPWPG
jgi:hypothetical protein